MRIMGRRTADSGKTRGAFLTFFLLLVLSSFGHFRAHSIPQFRTRKAETCKIRARECLIVFSAQWREMNSVTLLEPIFSDASHLHKRKQPHLSAPPSRKNKSKLKFCLEFSSTDLLTLTQVN